MTLRETPSVARWTTRAGVYSCLIALVALAAHRFGPMPTQTAFNLLIISCAGAILTLVLGVIAGAVIWHEGRTGAVRVSIGMALALALLGWPVAFLPVYRSLPAITDVTTDTSSPPKFVELAKLRGPESNPAAYVPRFAKLQAEAYPDLKPMFIDRPVDETFEIAREAVFRQKMAIVREQPPDNVPGAAGAIEAVDRTAILGLTDDVSVRVEGDNVRSKIDLRSSSRFGRHDLGRNAERMRRLMREIVARLEATVPSENGESYVKWRKRGPRVVVKHALDTIRKAKASGDGEAKSSRKEQSKRNRSQE